MEKKRSSVHGPAFEQEFARSRLLKSIVLFKLGNKNTVEETCYLSKGSWVKITVETTLFQVPTKQERWGLGRTLKCGDYVDKNYLKGYSVHKENIGQTSLKRSKRIRCKTKKLKHYVNKQNKGRSWKDLPGPSKPTQGKKRTARGNADEFT